ncbi:MAG: hypothetical protein KAR00_02580 [Candidatus Pacebacteria bacterium]|nr:hypothetical protein [Candidatus Paceibacterota bacterium]
MKNLISTIDHFVIKVCRKLSLPFGRLALFVVYFWFGILKIIGRGYTNPLIENLMEQTLPFMTFSSFIIGFSIYEVIIGILFLIPKWTRLAIFLLLPHIIIMVFPLFLIPEVMWEANFIPTLEGQYIIKNLLVIALAISLAARLTPLRYSVLRIPDE